MICRQTEAVRESIDFSEYSEMSLEWTRFRRLLHPDEEVENSETWYTRFYNTALYGDAQRLWKSLVASMREIACDYSRSPSGNRPCVH